MHDVAIVQGGPLPNNPAGDISPLANKSYSPEDDFANSAG